MASTTSTAPAANRAGRTILATRPLMGWRTIDLLTATFLGVGIGVLFYGWAVVSPGLTTAVAGGYPPLAGLLNFAWLIGGVLGGLIIRRPGAAIVVEVIAALVEALLGSSFGWTAVVSGLCQGLGAELAFAAFAYRRFGLGTAMLAGLLSVPFEMIYERFTSLGEAWSWGQFVVYVGCSLVAGALLTGPISWVLTRALASSGALRAFPPGQEWAEARLGR